MIRLEKVPDGFKIYFNDHLFIHHTNKKPCVALGKGSAKYKTRFGGFKIKQSLKMREGLNKSKILSQSPEEGIEIELIGEEEKLNLTIEVVDDKLEIVPKCSNPEINRFWITFEALPDEAIFGCGEQFSELNLKGKNVPLWSEEQGLCRGSPKWLTAALNLIYIGGHWYNTYFPQPTFISTKNYYCHVDTSAYAEFNFKKKNLSELYFFEIPERISIGKYDTAVSTVSALSELLGKQPELPEWAFDGVWLGVQGGKDVVEEKLKLCLYKGVKVGAIWCQDWEGIRMRLKSKRLFWNWIYDKELYPELPSYIKSLNEKGIRFMGYINPFLATDGELYEQASEGGYCIKDQEGNDYAMSTGNGETTLIDLSNPETIKWIKSVIKEHMIGIGLSGWMADFGEYLPTDAVLHSGESAEKFHNKYPAIWSQTVYEAIKEAGKLGEVISFNRSGYTTTSKYSTLMWAGDQLVDWNIDDGLASVIPAGLSLGLCGIGYFHSDIGGYSTFFKFKRTPELFMRWAEHSAFTMVMRTHEGNIPERNVQFDDDVPTKYGKNYSVVDHFAKMSQIHVHLKPYKIFLSKEYQETGLSPMRPCYLHYEDDPNLHFIKYIYLFGRDLLVAPVIKPDRDQWELYFPDDTWVHIWSGKEYTKGWNTVDAPVGQPPVFYRKGSNFEGLFKEIKDI